MGKPNLVTPRLKKMYYPKLNLIRSSPGSGEGRARTDAGNDPNTFLQSQGLGTMLSSRQEIQNKQVQNGCGIEVCRRAMSEKVRKLEKYLTPGKIIRGQRSEFMSKNLTPVRYFSTIFVEQNSKTICYKCTNFIVLMDFYFKNKKIKGGRLSKI